MNNPSVLANEKIGKLLLKFSIPAITGMLVNALYNIVDRIYIGHIGGDVGKYAMAGLAITFPISNIVLAFTLLIGIGSAALISIRMGQGNKESAERILGNAFVLTLIISAIITFFGLLFIDPVLDIMGTTDNTMQYAREYIQIILSGCVFMITGFGLNHCMRAEGHPRKAMITMLLGAILNIILDPIFIYSFNMGVKGAAIATIISQAAAMTWVLLHFFGKKGHIILRVKNMGLKIGVVLRIFSIGISSFSVQIANSLVMALMNNQLGSYGGSAGDLAIGASSAIISISMIFLMPVIGLNQGAQPIIGYNYGAQRYDRVKHTLRLAIIAALVVSAVVEIVIQVFPGYLIRLFNGDSQLVEIGSKGLRLYLIILPVVALQLICSNFFQAIGKALKSVILSLLRQVILLIPMLLILPRLFGLNGVWIATPVSDFISAVVTFVFVIYEMKMLDRMQDSVKVKEETSNV